MPKTIDRLLADRRAKNKSAPKTVDRLLADRKAARKKAARDRPVHARSRLKLVEQRQQPASQATKQARGRKAPKKPAPRDPKAWRKKANKQGGGKSPAIAKVRPIRRPTGTGSKRGKGTLRSRR